MTCRPPLRTQRLLLLGFLCALLSLGVGAAIALGQKRATNSPGTSKTFEPQSATAIMEAMGADDDHRLADQSMALREQADFLLTPALLVQEAISDDVVLTYPEE